MLSITRFPNSSNIDDNDSASVLMISFWIMQLILRDISRRSIFSIGIDQYVCAEVI